MKSRQYTINEKWLCESCGEFHPFGGYVAAHWNEKLVHTCTCGQRHTVCRGKVTPLDRKPERAK